MSDAGESRPAGTSHLCIRGLRKQFGDRTVLDGVDLSIDRGEYVALLGANGSGKSTALRCCVGLLEADAGTIEVGGNAGFTLRGGRLAAHRQQTAMIFQQIHLVGRRSALDNVCAGALGRLGPFASCSPLLFPSELRTEAMACLERVGLADRASDRVKALSGGQRQRVAIARALCQRASVVLADEPVSALDPAATEQVMELLHSLAVNDNLAVCVVLHHPELARRHAHRIAGLSAGRVLFDEPIANVSGEAIEQLYAEAPTTPELPVGRGVSPA